MSKSIMSRRRTALLTVALGALTTAAFSAPFTQGNLVVVRVGSGASALASNTAAPVFLDEYTTTGTLVQTITVPTTTALPNLRLTLGGLNNSEGNLSLSANHEYLTFGGYDIAVGATNIVATTAAATPRVIARVDSTGAIDTSTSITDGFSTGRIAGVTTDDGTRFWAGGAATGGGIRYSLLGATTSTAITGTPNNNRFPGIYNGQLYSSISFSPNYIGVSSIGSGLPTTGASGNSPTLLPGFFTSGTHSPFGWYFLDANTIFLCDSGTTANGGGLQKWNFGGATWTQPGAPFPHVPPTTSNGLIGITGTSSGLNVDLYVISADASANSLLKWSSTDGGNTGTYSVLAVAPTVGNNTVFRGVAFAPYITPPDTTDPTSTAAAGDLTQVGGNITGTYTADDGSGSGVASVDLYVKAPAGAWANAGAVSGGVWSYPAAAGDGSYSFATVATDVATNVETAPAGADPGDVSVSWNDTANGSFAHASVSDGTFTFPMTSTLDIGITFSGGATGGPITVSRTTGDVSEAGLVAADLIDEMLTISGTFTGSASITWNYDPLSDDGLSSAFDSVFQVDGGVLTNTFPVTAANPIVVGPVTSFSNWYAGIEPVSAVSDWAILDTE